jgi:hypothetical protein
MTSFFSSPRLRHHIFQLILSRLLKIWKWHHSQLYLSIYTLHLASVCKCDSVFKEPFQQFFKVYTSSNPFGDRTDSATNSKLSETKRTLNGVTLAENKVLKAENKALKACLHKTWILYRTTQNLFIRHKIRSYDTNWKASILVVQHSVGRTTQKLCFL